MFVNEEDFRTDSKMISTGGDHLLFTSSNDIHLLNVNISATIDMLQSSDIRHRLWTLALVCSSETVKDQFSACESVCLNECWTFHYKSQWVWDLNIGDVSKSPPAHLLLC